MEALIKIKDLNFTYNEGDDNEFRALININLKIYPKEFVIIFGPSGCGKSTLLNIIAGLETPKKGTVFVFGKDISKMNRKEFIYFHRKNIGMIYQAYNLITSLTVLDNVALPQMFLSVSKRKREKWSLDLLKRFNIDEQAKKVPTELSGGQQQRIGIARAIVNNPDIILADEPIGNLDSSSAKNVFEILGELNSKEKKTVILVTHNPECLEYGDRIFYMKDGMIAKKIVNREEYIVEDGHKKSPTTEMESLMRAYKGLTPEQINVIIMPYKARLFAHHFITDRNMEEIKILENIIQKKLLNNISTKEFFNTLRRSYQDRGVGLSSATAEKIVNRINRKLRLAYYIYRKGRQRKDEHGMHEKITNEEKINKATYYLLKTCYNEYYHNLNKVEVIRFKKAVENRIWNKFNKINLYSFLDKPLREGGVGLNSKTARAITEELELILILGYGIIPRLQAKKEFMSQEKKLEAQKAKIAQRITHNS